MLTRKQLELLSYIQKRLADDGVSPSFDEMKEALELRSKSGIHRLITALEERGFIRRLAHRARALEVLKQPEEAAGRRAFKVLEGGGQSAPRPAPPATPERAPANHIPLWGTIAAGYLGLSDGDDQHELIEVPLSLVRGGEHFAMKVKGDSMIEAGINEGDIVILRRTEVAENNQIVAVTIDQESEATLKTFKRHNGSIALVPANNTMSTKIYGPERVRVHGKLVGLIRRFD